MNRILIVDGSNLLFQMFLGMPARIVNAQGKAIQGTLGGALLKMIRRVEPTHIAVIFDGEHENSCAAIDPEYKANRVDYSQTPEEETTFSQLGDVYAELDFMGVCHTETTGCETDDLIAAYAPLAGRENEAVISSFDSDFFSSSPSGYPCCAIAAKRRRSARRTISAGGCSEITGSSN